MAKIWELTTPEGRLGWAKLYYRVKKKRWSPPEKDKPIICEIKSNPTERK